MKQYDLKNKKIVEVEQYCLGSLHFLYQTTIGRVILKVINLPWLSKLYGAYQNSARSTRKIEKFVEQYKIDLSSYEEEHYQSFNQFFSRKIKPEERPFSVLKEDFCSPCDSKVTMYSIDSHLVFQVKQSRYTVASLLQDESLASAYAGGVCMVFRLTVDDYHRYHFFDDGSLKRRYPIAGRLHTVSPIAFERYSVFSENSREISLLETENFGSVVQVEVGALMVGKIVNHDVTEFHRGDEKGYFQFGGSTILLLFKKDVVNFDPEFLKYATSSTEVIVKMGQVLGKKVEHRKRKS